MGHTETRTGTLAPTEVFRTPRFSLIARPQFLEPEHLAVQWRGEASDGERLAEYAGRLCYMSQRNPVNRTTAEYLENIKKQGHGSVLEHSVYVLLIEGISRSCSHELVRHRAGFGYSQISQRYVDESHAAFVLPPAVAGDAKLEEEWQRQVAEAQIVVSGNARAWRTMLELRCGEGAELEIRRMAIAVLRVLQREAGALFSDFETYVPDDKQEAARVTYHKV